jgi:uncharacterized repeat protein (TIGR01451 family)
MAALWRRGAAVLCAGALAFAGGAARADTPIALYKSFAGNVNFTGTQKTMRTKANGTQACAVVASGTDVSAVLSGIPPGATVLSAQLYWAGSSATADNTVTFDGVSKSAPVARQYSSTTIGAGYTYFGGAIDVTTEVVAKRNATYRFSGLTINNGAPYCEVEGVLGGFALLVVYSDPGEQFRVLNMYEGFQFIRYSAVTLTLSNFRTPSPLGAATGRIGHLTWEGDGSLATNGEDLLFNNIELYDTLNPRHNQFNSASNINNDSASFGIDFDAYTVGSDALGPGQTRATSTYQSGQDLVLLNAEIIALPNVPAADLVISLTRNTALVLGQKASYTLGVSNGGPSAETGPVVVTDTLPAGLSLVSASGSGWSCSSAGKVVTCSRAGSLAAGASLPPLTLTVSVDASGTQDNTASVSGQQFDFVSGNNSAADSATVSGAAAYAFTDAACVHGVAFGAAQRCKLLSGAGLAAGDSAAVFVTALTNGVPSRLSATADTTVQMSFALSCINPASDAGVKANYAGVSLPLCTANGAAPAAVSGLWSAPVDMVFKSGVPSAPANAGFNYADVGKVQLFLRDTLERIVGAVPFVVKPASLAIRSVTRSADGFVNPAAADGAGGGFARAGEAFTVKAGALTRSGALAPNFGNETVGARLTLDALRGGDAAVQAAMLALPPLSGEFTAVVGGEFTGAAFSFDEAGILSLTPRLTNNDYLGAGAPAALATSVGRFYPDHFDTFATATMACMPNMACPSTASGAVYSGQPFAVTVKPMNGTGALLNNFNGVLARTVTLAAVGQAGGATFNPAGGTLSAGSIAPASMLPRMPIGANPVYTLPRPYSNAAPRARNWIVPTPIYLRASAADSAVVSSLRGAASVEGGATIVSGRLALSSPAGSELLKMPVRAEAQYWAATARWEHSAKDQASTVQSGAIAFANCLKRLGPPCKAALLGVTANTSVPMKDGQATFWLRAPGPGNVGSAEFQMGNPAWLPSTIGRAAFGIYNSPLIYLREVY